MSISDTSQARKYASIAEVAAAQAKLSADKLESAPDYAQQAKEYSEAAELSSQTAQQAESATIDYALSASQSASDAASSASEAGAAAEAAVARCVRVPDGESISILPASASRELKVLTFDENADVSLIDKDKFAIVDGSGKIPVSMIPSIALTEPFVVSSEAAMLALDAQVGDIAKRTDLGYSFCLASSPASVLGNWVQLTDDVLAQLGQQTGATQVGALNDAASPTTVQGALDEKATKSSLTSFVNTLASTSGAASVGVLPKGNLSQLLNYVTPEQFGAIGDGTAHPLSERYSTLAAAQADYPFVTALTQTIDWAACQLAENLNRKVRPIYVAKFKKYHLGNDYLKLGPYSTWIAPPLNDFVWDTGFIRSVPSDYSSYAFGQLCIVRVGNASEFTGDGVTGDNVRNITFKGFQLRWDVARHTPSKGVGTICLHMNNAMKMNLDVCLYGGEFAAFGYSCWGTQGSIKMDSCHKGIYWDAVSKTPEKSTEGGSTTSHNVELQIDHTIFPVYLRNCNYAKFHGWFEGALTSMAHYDSANETAMGITLDTCDGVIFDMGVEAWQGALLNCIGSVEAEFSFAMLPGEILPGGLGTQGVAYRIRALMSATDETAIPSANRSLSYVTGYSTVTIKHWQPVVTPWPTGGTTKYVTSVDATSKVTFQDCGVYLGGASTLGGGDARLKLAPANYANIEAIGGMYIERYLKPSSSYDYAGRSVSVHNAWQGATIAADGTVTINAPTNFKIVDFTAMVGVGTNAQPSGVGIKSSSDTSIVLQTTANASYGINYRLWVKPTL